MTIYGPNGVVSASLASAYTLKSPDGQSYRFKDGKGLQVWNADTSKWHTIIVTGNPPALATDDGET